MLDTKDKGFLKSCHFGPKNPYCPIFRLGSVVSWTGSNFQEIALQVGSVHWGALPAGRGGGCLRALGLSSGRGWGGGGSWGRVVGGNVECPAPGTHCLRD